MISSKTLRELGDLWTEAADALSIYFEPSPPSELSQREETTLAKERIQQAIGTVGHLQVVGSTAPRAFVQRAIEAIADMEGTRGCAKVIFAAPRNNIWREFDVPGKFGVRVDLGKAFTIAPLVAQQENQPRFGVVLVDRDHTRMFLLAAGALSEDNECLAGEPQKLTTPGARRSSHIERSKDDRTLKRFRAIGSQLLRARERHDFDSLLLGCRDELREAIEEVLPPQLKQHLIGHFRVDPATTTLREVQEKAEKVIAAHDCEELRELEAKTMDEAATARVGALGLPDVIEALARNEVRMLLLPDPRTRFTQGAGLCSKCGHLALDSGKQCSLCGGLMRYFTRADEAMVRKACAAKAQIRSLRHTSAHPEKEVGAWLRFRIEPDIRQALAS